MQLSEVKWKCCPACCVSHLPVVVIVVPLMRRVLMRADQGACFPGEGGDCSVFNLCCSAETPPNTLAFFLLEFLEWTRWQAALAVDGCFCEIVTLVFSLHSCPTCC